MERNTLFTLNLRERRQELGMPVDVVAKRSGVSVATVKRILCDDYRHASFENVARVAEALGVDVALTPAVSANELREQQAKRKAEQLVRQVQGTSALEAQQVDSSRLREMLHRTVHDLLSGSRGRLWAA